MHVRVCMCMHIHICVYVYIYVCVCVCVYVYVTQPLNLYIYIPTALASKYMCVYVYALPGHPHLYVYIPTAWAFTYICIYTHCVGIHMYMCICTVPGHPHILIYIYTSSHTDAQIKLQALHADAQEVYSLRICVCSCARVCVQTRTCVSFSRDFFSLTLTHSVHTRNTQAILGGGPFSLRKLRMSYRMYIHT